uniref:Peptidase_S26 domain-containing protein n=1 Tax=Panagrellus redivivus TaxID=6233 RepID=A0A7E4VVM9_PANRE
MPTGLDTTLMPASETVIRVWDPNNPRVSASVRLLVGDALSPLHMRDFFVGDLVCFDLPVGSSITWSTTGSSSRILRFIKGNVGRAALNSAGETFVFAKLNSAGQNATAPKSEVTASHFESEGLSFERSFTPAGDKKTICSEVSFYLTYFVNFSISVMPSKSMIPSFAEKGSVAMEPRRMATFARFNSDRNCTEILTMPRFVLLNH